MTIQDTPTPAGTGSESLLQNGKSNFTPKLPAHDTLRALILAVILKGYEVCQRVADHVLTFFEIDLNHFRKAQPNRREADND